MSLCVCVCTCACGCACVLELCSNRCQQVSNVAELAHRILAKIPENSVPPDKRSYAFGR